MLAMDVLRLAAVGSITLAVLTDHLNYPQLLAVSLVEGAASAVFGSATIVFFRIMVPPGLVSRALSQAQASFGVIALVGPIAGGALYGVDRVLPFIADAGSYLLSAVLLFVVTVPAHPPADDKPAEGEQDRRVTAGMQWLWRQRDILRVVLLGGVLELVGAASGMAAVVVMSQRGTPSSVIGIVMACAGVGLVTGSLVTRWVVTLGPARLYLTSGMRWAGAMASVATSSSPWTVGAALTFLAVLQPSIGVMLFQILADRVPKGLFGRVTAADALLSSGLATAGPLVAGVLVAAFGGTYLWLVLAGTCLLATVLTIGPLLMSQRAVGKI